jgi:hypothetical protein
MPTYWFNLKTRDGTIIDSEGTDLPNDASAYAYAEAVAVASATVATALLHLELLQFGLARYRPATVEPLQLGSAPRPRTISHHLESCRGVMTGTSQP